jgi:hypothetical protein
LPKKEDGVEKENDPWKEVRKREGEGRDERKKWLEESGLDRKREEGRRRKE